VPLDWFRQPAAVVIAGAIGLLAGLFVPVIGIAAAIGVILHFIGAVSFHVCAHDTALARPVVIGLLGVATSSSGSRPSETRGTDARTPDSRSPARATVASGDPDAPQVPGPTHGAVVAAVVDVLVVLVVVLVVVVGAVVVVG
jgi:hypothetical protein